MTRVDPRWRITSSIVVPAAVNVDDEWSNPMAALRMRSRHAVTSSGLDSAPAAWTSETRGNCTGARDSGAVGNATDAT